MERGMVRLSEYSEWIYKRLWEISQGNACTFGSYENLGRSLFNNMQFAERDLARALLEMKRKGFILLNFSTSSLDESELYGRDVHNLAKEAFKLGGAIVTPDAGLITLKIRR